MIMISLIHHSGRVKSVMVFIFGCHVLRVLNKVERPRQTPWAYKLSKPEKKNIQISLSYSKIVRSHFLRQRKSPFVHQMFPFLLKNGLLWRSCGMNTVHVCSSWMLQTVDKDCWFVAFFCFNMIPDLLFFQPRLPFRSNKLWKEQWWVQCLLGWCLILLFFPNLQVVVSTLWKSFLYCSVVVINYFYHCQHAKKVVSYSLGLWICYRASEFCY